MSTKIAYKRIYNKGKRSLAWPTRFSVCWLFHLEGLGILFAGLALNPKPNANAAN